MPARRIAILAVVILEACAHPRAGTGVSTPGGEAREPTSERCLLAGGSTGARAPVIRIGLTDPVEPRHAPIPTNDGERLVFRHLYETPVRFDCEGKPAPELAEQWVRDDDGRRWTLRLRGDAQFWDGAPVTAQDVAFGRGGVGYMLRVLEPRVLTVLLAKQANEVPPILADPSLAIVKPAPDTSWPIGTGAYWATSATTTAQEIRAQNSRGDTLVFRVAAGSGARDLLDGGVDLLVTRDRALRDYAATLKDRTVVALPWDRTYVYVTPEAAGTRFDGLEQSVRADARSPEGDVWWHDLRSCGSAGGGAVRTRRRRRLEHGGFCMHDPIRPRVNWPAGSPRSRGLQRRRARMTSSRPPLPWGRTGATSSRCRGRPRTRAAPRSRCCRSGPRRSPRWSRPVPRPSCAGGSPAGRSIRTAPYTWHHDLPQPPPDRVRGGGGDSAARVRPRHSPRDGATGYRRVRTAREHAGQRDQRRPGA